MYGRFNKRGIAKDNLPDRLLRWDASLFCCFLASTGFPLYFSSIHMKLQRFVLFLHHAVINTTWTRCRINVYVFFFVYIFFIVRRRHGWACSGPGIEGWRKKYWMSLNRSHYNVGRGTRSRRVSRQLNYSIRPLKYLDHSNKLFFNWIDKSAALRPSIRY